MTPIEHRFSHKRGHVAQNAELSNAEGDQGYVWKAWFDSGLRKINLVKQTEGKLNLEELFGRCGGVHLHDFVHCLRRPGASMSAASTPTCLR